MKRLIVLFALVIAFALLVACTAPSPEPIKPPTTAPTQPPAPVSAQPTTATQPTATPAKKVEITFWKHSHPPADDLTKKLIEEYQAKNPNVTIKMELIPNEVWLTKMLTAVAGDQAPDMYDTNDTTLLTFVSKGVLAPVDPAAFGFKTQEELEKAYVSNSLNPFKGDDGKIYGIPFEYNSWPMIINDQIFKVAGLDPAKDYPKTWEEVGTVGAKLAVVKDGRFDRVGFTWNLFTAGYSMLLYPPIVYQLGGSVLSKDDKGNECAINSPEGVQALQMMQDVYYKYKAGAPGIALATAAAPMEDFVKEKQGMTIIGPWGVPFFNDNKSVMENYRVIPLPQATGAKRKVVSLSSWAWIVNKKSPNALEAWKFVDYAQQQGSRWLPAAGYVLPRLGWTNSPEAKAFKGLDVFIDQMQYARPRLQHPNSSEINAEVHKAVQAAILNNAPAKQVLDAACIEINKIVKK